MKTVIPNTRADMAGSSQQWQASEPGCVDADTALIKRIRQNPENFYINVHNSEFPDGAVRGQLSKK